MKHNVDKLKGFTIGATDGELGKVKEFYFDDSSWTIRYLVVETGNWLSGRKVLIPTDALLQPDWEAEVFPVKLTMDQVKQSPDINTDKPVSRSEEEYLYAHYGWTGYWGSGLAGSLWAGGVGTSGMYMPGPGLADTPLDPDKEKRTEPKGDPHLRSTKKVKGYSIHATDGTVGEVEDYIIDDTTWKVDFLVVDTGNWLPGKKVLLSPKLITEIKWDTSEVIVNTTEDKVKNSPEFHPEELVSDDYHSRLHTYYGTT